MPTVKKTVPAKKTVIASKAKQSNKPKKIATKPSVSRKDKLSVPVYSLAGRANGTLSLPKEIFGKEVNKKLLAQAIRVYMTNKASLLGQTKSRGEVEGSTAKIWNQKGTGRARHGSIRAPIFVGGGITFGPQSRKVRLALPRAMKRAALIAALSSKAAEKEILGVSGLEKASGKTSEMVKLVKKMNVRNALIVTGERLDNVVRAVGNIQKVDVLPVNLINAYEVLKHHMLLITKDAVEGLKK